MKKWTKKEDAILLKAVVDANDNLSLAFRAASELVDRTPEACRGRWGRIRQRQEGSVALMSFARPRKQKQLEIPFQEKASWWDVLKLQIRKWFKR